MDRREFALRQFSEVMRERPPFMMPTDVSRLTHWLRDNVCAVMDQFIRRPAFRNAATWPLRTFEPTSASAERTLLQRVDDLLVAYASAITELADVEPYRGILASSDYMVQVVSRESVVVGDGRERVLEREFTDFDELAHERSQTEGISTRYWDALVSPLDYFYPYHAFSAEERGKRQWASLIPSLNRDLHPVGDFITRCMLERIDMLRRSLEGYRSKVRTAVAQTSIRHDQLLEREEATWDELVACIDQLRSASSDAANVQLYDSCVILTQVYVAFRSEPDVKWLGLPEHIIQSGVALSGLCGSWSAPEIADRVAVALRDLGRLYEHAAPNVEAFEEAVGTLVLVVNKATCELYWRGEPVVPKGSPWSSRRPMWSLFCKLVESCEARSSISAADVYDEIKGDSTLSTAIGRLRKKLPPELAELIVLGGDAATYRIDLKPHEVYFVV